MEAAARYLAVIDLTAERPNAGPNAISSIYFRVSENRETS